MSPTTTSEPHDASETTHGAIGRLSVDEELQQVVCQALIEDTELDSTEIRVRVAQENVVLSGRVESGAARERAITIARAQRGVADVQADELRTNA
jgi:osmotically-inducible protein OsmY